ncbi:hypothetical protein MASR2M70_16530 [Bacillota bacterium]
MIKLKKPAKIGIPLILLVLLLSVSSLFEPEAFAEEPLRLVVDGKDVTAGAVPVIQNSRTLVPLRVVAEELGSEVSWNGNDRTVLIVKGNDKIKLKIDSRLVQSDKGGKQYFLSDVSPVIIGDRTYVPLRLIGNMLGIGVEWSGAKRLVSVDSAKPASFAPFYNVKLLNISQGQAIDEKTALQISAAGQDLTNAKEIKYILMDPDTYKGDVIARGSLIDGKYSWIPRLSQKPESVLIAAVYDSKGKFLAGDAVNVKVNIVPTVSLKGITQDQAISGDISIGADLNFVASYVKYEIQNLDKGTKTLTSESDPYGLYKWSPQLENNGNAGFKVIAYDENGNSYESDTVTASVGIAKRLFLSGVKNGQTIDKSVSLLASRNFSVSETEYFMKDKATGIEATIAKIPWGSYQWFPGPEVSGDKDVFVRVKDGAGNVYVSPGISVKIPGEAKAYLVGIGPNQVVSAPVKLTAKSNVKLDSVNYTVTNLGTGSKSVIASGQDPSAEFTYSPGSSGNYQIQVEGLYGSSKIFSEQISYKVYLEKTYGSKPVIEKSKFMGLASDLAKKSWESTGMSAALQTAQAILETGWGQSVPVDKYSGKFSNNLFGIKGNGSAGSVTSNTWEEYNGTTFRIDADFRAYNNINESWNDHKKLLLEKERYGIFRDVMYDSTLGAWAIRRAGYATDSQYPIKLMNLIKQYKLQELDKISI